MSGGGIGGAGRRLKGARGSCLLWKCPPSWKHKENPMRVAKICRQLTGVEALYASDWSLEESGLVFSVRPRWRRPRCGG